MRRRNRSRWAFFLLGGGGGQGGPGSGVRKKKKEELAPAGKQIAKFTVRGTRSEQIYTSKRQDGARKSTQFVQAGRGVTRAPLVRKNVSKKLDSQTKTRGSAGGPAEQKLQHEHPALVRSHACVVSGLREHDDEGRPLPSSCATEGATTLKTSHLVEQPSRSMADARRINPTK